MGQMEWAMWANEQALLSGFITGLGGILGVIGMFPRWQVSAFAIPASVLVLIIEYPRGKRKKGSSPERRFQSILTKLLTACGPMVRNYYIRFIFHLLIGVPCWFVLPTILGGVCLSITSIMYLVAAVHGEEWIPCGEAKKPPKLDTVVAKPPNYPPPRRMDARGVDNPMHVLAEEENGSRI